MTPLFRKFLSIHWLLLISVFGIAIFGIFALYSATSFREGNLSQIWSKQINWLGLGVIVFFVVALIDYFWIKFAALLLYLISLGLLIAVHFKGELLSGARSWINLGPMHIQPSQVAIMSGIMLMAVILSDLPKLHAVFRPPIVRLILCLIVAGVPMLLILKEPDLGSAVVWGPTLICMLMVASIPKRYLFFLGLSAAIVVPWVYFFKLEDYQKKRITTYISILKNEKINEQAEGWASSKIRLAVSTGGYEGKGFLAKKIPGQRSVNRLGLIPGHTAFNDYIFAVIAEEHGFRGGALLISAFIFMLVQCVFVAYHARDSFGRLLVAGVIGMVFTHVFLNIGMNVLLVPITGLPLPLVSYGGTFLLVILFLMGIVQSVWVHHTQMDPLTLKDEKNQAKKKKENLEKSRNFSSPYRLHPS